jgi:CubicO group peptidase (beta-lactamase class C family)
MYTSRPLVLNLASCLSLATLVASFPADYQDLSLSRRDAAIEQSVFYDINSTELETRIAKLKAEGYQPTSLNIHGSPTDAKYAGIWTKQTGDAYETILGANESSYNAWVDHWRASGYVSTHVSATGVDSDARFAGVMQQLSGVQNWLQLCGVNDPFAYLNATIDTPMIVKGVSMYGLPSEPQYCILGHENTVNYQQTVWYQTKYIMDDYKTLEASETSKRFWRPVYIDVSDDHVLTPIFDDTSVGKWAALTDLTPSQLDSEIAAKQAKNMYPIHISGGGASGAKYAVIFAEQVTPLEREWHATGAITGFSDNAAFTDKLDSTMEAFMKRNSVRQAQVAASVNGTVIASRGYTWAESDRAVVEPSDKFLLGSVSKMFTYAATNRLISDGLINLTTPVYPLLGYNDPADNRSLDITVQHLLDHTGGFDRSMSPDIGFIFRTVAESLKQSTPATLRQLIEYVVAKPLDFTPGDRSVYSNYGTLMMSYVIANLTGESYTSYIEKNVLGGADVELYSTAAEQHKSDRIVQESKFTMQSALTPSSNVKVPTPHGGDGAIKEEAIGSFGMKASATTISQFLASHSAYSIGGRSPFSYRDGSVSGARAIAYSTEHIDWALVLNTREYVNEAAWEDLIFNKVGVYWDEFELA